MRHRKSGRQLNRNASHRKAMFQNMSNALLRHETIETTLPKAKELRRFVEPLITKAKIDSVHNRRYAFARLRDDEIVAKLFNDIAPFYQNRPGGYTRVLKAGFRSGDKAPMALIQLVDFVKTVENADEEKASQSKASKESKESKESKTDSKAPEQAPSKNLENNQSQENT